MFKERLNTASEIPPYIHGDCSRHIHSLASGTVWAQSIIECELIPIKAHWTATNGPREMPQGASAFNFFCLFRWENVSFLIK